jgi:DNA-binding CsgD family transcriptional regulator
MTIRSDELDSINRRLGSYLGRRRLKEGFQHLTPSERRVLDLIAEDYTNAEIAAILICSPATVKTHAHHILQKLGLASRREAGRLRRQRSPAAGDDYPASDSHST